MGCTGPTPCQIDKWNCQVFINIEKYKIVFKIRKDHMKIFFFLMAYKASVLSKFTSMQDLENNDWIILDHICENPSRKNFINRSCPRHSKTIN